MNEEFDFLNRQSEFLQQRKLLQEHSDDIEKNVIELAACYRKAFNALVGQGFNEEQALELIKAKGPFLTW